MSKVCACIRLVQQQTAAEVDKRKATNGPNSADWDSHPVPCQFVSFKLSGERGVPGPGSLPTLHTYSSCIVVAETLSEFSIARVFSSLPRIVVRYLLASRIRYVSYDPCKHPKGSQICIYLRLDSPTSKKFETSGPTHVRARESITASALICRFFLGDSM